MTGYWKYDFYPTYIGDANQNSWKYDFYPTYIGDLNQNIYYFMSNCSSGQ